MEVIGKLKRWTVPDTPPMESYPNAGAIHNSETRRGTSQGVELSTGNQRPVEYIVIHDE
jgi:hypothetical protein